MPFQRTLQKSAIVSIPITPSDQASKGKLLLGATKVDDPEQSWGTSKTRR